MRGAVCSANALLLLLGGVAAPRGARAQADSWPTAGQLLGCRGDLARSAAVEWAWAGALAARGATLKARLGPALVARIAAG